MVELRKAFIMRSINSFEEGIKGPPIQPPLKGGWINLNGNRSGRYHLYFGIVAIIGISKLTLLWIDIKCHLETVSSSFMVSLGCLQNLAFRYAIGWDHLIDGRCPLGKTIERHNGFQCHLQLGRSISLREFEGCSETICLIDTAPIQTFPPQSAQKTFLTPRTHPAILAWPCTLKGHERWAFSPRYAAFHANIGYLSISFPSVCLSSTC